MKGNLQYIEAQANKLRMILEEIDAYMDRLQVGKLRNLLNAGTRRLGSYMQPTKQKRPSLNTDDLDDFV
jgi:hypothetical protein